MKKWLLVALLIPQLLLGVDSEVPKDLAPAPPAEPMNPANNPDHLPNNSNFNPCNSAVCNFETEPSAIVGNVNVITGDYLEFSTDIIIPGPEPLILQRSY